MTNAMKYDPAARALSFNSQEELEAFHQQLSSVVRAAMVGATRHIQDPQQAKLASSQVLKEISVLMRTLNVVRRNMSRKSFG